MALANIRSDQSTEELNQLTRLVTSFWQKVWRAFLHLDNLDASV